MKKWAAICVFLLVLLMAATACADNFKNPEYTPEYIAEQEQMLANIESLFPRLLFKQTFDGTNKPVITKPENGYYMYTREVLGKRERCLSAYTTAPFDKGWGEHYFNTTGSFTDFYMSIEGQIIERDDTQKGYLWIQYTDGNIAGEEGRSAASINFPVDITQYDTVNGSRTYTTLYDLSAYGEDYEVHRFEIFRLDGFTRVYIDGHFITGFADGFSGRFYQIFGTGMKEGGRYVTAQFDNLVLRMRSY